MSTAPHDALFKAVFGQPEHARGALRAVVPAAMAEALDWSTLALQPGSFVDPELSPSHTDLLYAAAWRGGAEVPVYVLFEHQSSADRWMPLRLLRYMVRIWERWLKDHQDATALPAIVPIVLGQGLPIFSGLKQPRRLTLVSSKAFPKGTVVQVYRPA